MVRSERIPIEKTVTDYYAVETQVEYIRREIEETVMVEQPVERTYDRIQYIPVETQIVHYPERDNYVPAPVQKRTEYIGVQGNAQQTGGVTTVSSYPAGYVQGSRVGATSTSNYVSSGQTATYAYPTHGETYTTSAVRNNADPVYTTGATYFIGGDGKAYPTSPNVGPYATRGNEVTYTTSGNEAIYTTGTSYPVNTTYQTGYVQSGSGVRSGGYVTGGSGVRGGNTTYVSSGSNLKGTSYDTNVAYY